MTTTDVHNLSDNSHPDSGSAGSTVGQHAGESPHTLRTNTPVAFLGTLALALVPATLPAHSTNWPVVIPDSDLVFEGELHFDSLILAFSSREGALISIERSSQDCCSELGILIRLERQTSETGEYRGLTIELFERLPHASSIEREAKPRKIYGTFNQLIHLGARAIEVDLKVTSVEYRDFGDAPLRAALRDALGADPDCIEDLGDLIYSSVGPSPIVCRSWEGLLVCAAEVYLGARIKCPLPSREDRSCASD